MTNAISRTASLLMTLALMLPAAAQETKITPALDGLFAAFATHSLVGLDDDHGQAQELDFYAAIIRDPRFAQMVGNVVVEAGTAQHQAIIDAYVAGETVAYTELRKVWTDPVGWITPPATLGVANLFATVRAVNAGLPAAQRIRVWLGDPPIDWNKVTTRADIAPVMFQRDAHAGELILREIIARNKKALVIYGGAHLRPVVPDGPVTLRAVVERRYPNAFFVIAPYTGGGDKACLAKFESRFAAGPLLAAPVKGGALEPLLRACPPTPNVQFGFPPTMSAEEQAKRRAAAMANAVELAMGLYADALLWLGPSASLTRSPMLPEIYMDADYRRELERRVQLRGLPPSALGDAARNSASPRPR